MTLLVLAILTFGLVHLIPAVPRAKSWAVAKLGKTYGPTYGILSALLFILILAAHRAAPSVQLYDPPTWGRVANIIFSLIAIIFVSIAVFRGSVRNRIKFPVAIAVAVWAGGHLLANGNTRDVVLFAGLAGLGGLFMFLHSRLVEWTPVEVRKGHNVLSILFGVAMFGVLVQAHGLIAGVPVINLENFLKT